MREKQGWTQFCLSYPSLTDDGWYYRVMRAIFSKGIARLIFENAFYKGIIAGVDMSMQQFRSAPPEPRSDQPESPG
jgi:hypothetical protein